MTNGTTQRVSTPNATMNGGSGNTTSSSTASSSSDLLKGSQSNGGSKSTGTGNQHGKTNSTRPGGNTPPRRPMDNTPPPRSQQPAYYSPYPLQQQQQQQQQQQPPSAAQAQGFYYQQQPYPAPPSDSGDSPSSGSYEAAFLQQYPPQQGAVTGSPFSGGRAYNAQAGALPPMGNKPGGSPLAGGGGVDVVAPSPPLSPYFLPSQPPTAVTGATAAAVSNMIYQATHGGGGGGAAAAYGNPMNRSNASSSSSLEQPPWSNGVRSAYSQALPAYPHAAQPSVPSPQMHGSVGIPIPYPGQQNQAGQVYSSRVGGNPTRSTSFDEMLPPPAIVEPQQQQHQQQQQQPHDLSPTISSPTLGVGGYYSSNAVNGMHSVAGGGGTFPPPPPWYATGQPDPYQNPHQRLPPHMPSLSYPTMQGGGGPSARQMDGNPHMAPYYQSGPSTPGPPIQTTSSNKGPDGSNLFIFHIPNHFTNQDMYHLFCPYGNLLSVRIMVEKDTGRSRGFGFVSYDSPESAALAIKELNGYVIGNKRLKVQHKQIKIADNRHNHSSYNHRDHRLGNMNGQGDTRSRGSAASPPVHTSKIDRAEGDRISSTSSPSSIDVDKGNCNAGIEKTETRSESSKTPTMGASDGASGGVLLSSDDNENRKSRPAETAGDSAGHLGTDHGVGPFPTDSPVAKSSFDLEPLRGALSDLSSS